MKLFRQDDRAQIKGIDLLDMAAQRGDDLHAAAADIDHGIARSFHVEVVQGAQGGQFRLFLAADDRDLQADCVGNGLDKGSPLAACRTALVATASTPITSVAVDDLLHPDKGFHGPLPGSPRYGAVLGDPFAQPHRRLFVVQHPELPELVHFHHDAADGVGADIDGRQPVLFHNAFLTRSPICSNGAVSSIPEKSGEELAPFCRYGIQNQLFRLGREAGFPDDPGKNIEIVHLSQHFLVLLDRCVELLEAGSDQKGEDFHPVAEMFDGDPQQMLCLDFFGTAGRGHQLHDVGKPGIEGVLGETRQRERTGRLPSGGVEQRQRVYCPPVTGRASVAGGISRKPFRSLFSCFLRCSC